MVQPAFFAVSDLFTHTHMYTNKASNEYKFNLLRSLILVFVVRTWQTVSFLTMIFCRNAAALTNSYSIVLIRLRKQVSIQTRFCTIGVNAVRSIRTNAACARALRSQ